MKFILIFTLMMIVPFYSKAEDTSDNKDVLNCCPYADNRCHTTPCKSVEQSAVSASVKVFANTATVNSNNADFAPSAAGATPAPTP